jgi:DEAD/DEAH box helicase domain-containing protein
MYEVIFDVETKSFFDEINGWDPSKLGVSIVSLYSRKLDENFNELEGKMESFWEEEIEKMWPTFQKADRIIGFNSKKFDVPTLIPYANFPLQKLPHFDILEKVKDIFGRRVSLDAIAKDTLNTQKSDHGANAVLYYRKGDEESLGKLKKYCEMDVLITRDIYDFGLKNKKLKFTDHWNTKREIEVDFGYPKNTIKPQASLF